MAMVECSKCGKYMFDLNVFGVDAESALEKKLCIDCQDLLKPEYVEHEKFIRCPACGECWDPRENGGDDDAHVFDHGHHEIHCLY